MSETQRLCIAVLPDARFPALVADVERAVAPPPTIVRCTDVDALMAVIGAAPVEIVATADERAVEALRARGHYALVLLIADPAQLSATDSADLTELVPAGSAAPDSAAIRGALGVLLARDPHGARRRSLAQAYALGAERFRDFAGSAATHFWEAGSDLRINQVLTIGEAAETPGTALGTLLGARIEEAAAQDRGGDGRLAARLAARAPFASEVVRLRIGPDRVRTIRLSGQPVFGRSGAFVGYRGSAADVTAETEAKRLALAAQIRLTEAVESMPAAFMLFDIDDGLVLWNTRATQLYPSARHLLFAGSRFDALMRAAAQGGDLPTARGRVDAWLAERMTSRDRGAGLFDEETATGLWIRSLVRRTSDGGTVVVASDITELKRSERDLRQAKEVAEQANLAKSRFLAAASHDLRQPLHAFGLLLGSLATRVRDAEGRHLAHRMEQALESMQGMFNALLDVSRLDAGVLRPEPDDFPLQRVLAPLAQEFAPVARDKGLRLRVRPTRLWVRSDPVLLDRIVRNLISNALRYTARGGVLVGARRRRGQVVVEVWDTGIGIPDEHRDTIFEEFRRLDSGARDTRIGLGLGLSIVKRLSLLLGHGIGLRSRVGRGSIFSVVLPEVQSAAIPREQQPVARRSLAGRCVAVLDDEPLAVEGVKRALESWGCASIAATTLADLLKRLDHDAVRTKAAGGKQRAGAEGRGRRIDALIVDFQLARDLTGIEAIAAIERQLRRSLPTLLVTGSTDPASLGAIRNSGHPWLSKPVLPGTLRDALEAMIGREQPPRPKSAAARKRAAPKARTKSRPGAASRRR